MPSLDFVITWNTLLKWMKARGVARWKISLLQQFTILEPSRFAFCKNKLTTHPPGTVDGFNFYPSAGEYSKRIDRLVLAALDPASGAPMKSQFFLPTKRWGLAFSTPLLSISMSPRSRYTSKACHWERAFPSRLVGRTRLAMRRQARLRRAIC